MINTKQFYDSLINLDIDFFTGVPDSLLKDICAYITDETPKERNIISANEGGAIGLAMGYNMATSKIPLVYMQNSGFGNTINPLLSLADPKVYGIPMLLLVGWRGEPNIKDEPQHVKQGEVSETLLQSLNIPYSIISSETSNLSKMLNDAMTTMRDQSTPYVILVRKGTFEPYSLKSENRTDFDLNREGAVKKIIDLISNEDIIVSTTGKTSREVFEYREEIGDSHEKDFLTVGGMGHTSQIALGIALSKPNRTVYCLDGDGAVLMHTGSLGIIGDLAPPNMKHIIINNGAHDSVGGQPTIGFDIDFKKIAEGFNYKETFQITTISEFNVVFEKFKNSAGPSLLEILVNKGARKDLGRPTISPKENKLAFQKNLEK
ncbi:phosphonopyruvate decarboxylase [Polaribacter gochangensis]|uniref:phosphonopyruvate decarboxylase n=1 Tax=Polaribacter gochangensis TaxID=3252903 RepID=UPI003904755C